MADLRVDSPSDTSGEVPEDAWVLIGSHRYSTTGSVVIREDGPRPTSLPKGWSWSAEERISELLGDTEGLQRQMRPKDDVSDLWFDARYAPLLQGAVIRSVYSMPVAVTFDDQGGLLSLVMPLVEPRASLNHPKIMTLLGDVAELSRG